MSNSMENRGNKHFTVSTIKLFFLTIIIISILIACSTIKTDKQAYTYSTVTDNHNYQIRVRSGNLMLDKVIHEAATNEFGKYLHVCEEGSFTGSIDINFLCKSKRSITGSSPGYINNVIYGNSWYTGYEAGNKGSGVSSSISGRNSTGMFNMQKCNMIIAIKKINGVQFWNAQDAYDGVSDFSRLFVQTVDQTAVFSLERLVSRFKHDFSLLGTLSEVRRQSKPPEAALVIKEKETLSPRIALPARMNEIKPPDASIVLKEKRKLTPRMMDPNKIKIKQEKSYLEF